MFKFIGNLFKKNLIGSKFQSESPITISFDGKGIYSKLNGSENGSVEWGSVDLIAICIEDEFLPFPYWYIGCEENLLRIPNDAVGGSELFFDGLKKYIDGYGTVEIYEIIIEASSAMEGSFVVWKAPSINPA